MADITDQVDVLGLLPIFWKSVVLWPSTLC